MDTVYIQAKRWALDKPVGRPDIQTFVGSLSGEGACKGIFTTTSRFSDDACRYVEGRIILIDGQQLTQLMVEYNIGVTAEDRYIVKRVDRDYFGLE